MTKRNIQSIDLPSSVGNAVGFTSTFVRTSGDTTGVSDGTAINTALQAGNVSLSGTYYLASAILMPSDVELRLIGAEVLVIPGVADNVIRNADQTAAGNGNSGWRIKGVGKAVFRNQTSTVFQSPTIVGATTAIVNSYIVPGSYNTWTASNYATSETIKISQCIKSGPNQWTVTVPAGFTLAHSAGNGIVSAQGRTQGGGTTNAQVGPQIGGYFVNVQNFSIEDVTFGPTGFMAMNFQGAVNGRISRVLIGQDRSIDHQDGIDFGPGCQNILVEGTRGQSSDDFHSIYAKNTGANISPWSAAQTATGRGIANLTFVGEQVSPGINYLRIQAGDSSTCTGIHSSNLRWLGPLYNNLQANSNYRNVLQFGAANYVTTLPNPGDLDDIAVSGFRGPCDSLIALDSIVTNVSVTDAQITGSFYGLVTNNVPNPVNAGGSAVTLAGSYGINLQNIRTTYLAASSGAATQCNVMALVSAVSVDKVNISKLRMASSYTLLANAGTVTNLVGEGWHLGTAVSYPLHSTVAETGNLRGLVIDTPYQLSGAFKTLGSTQCKLVISQPFPILTAQDVVPTPTVGSQIICRGDLDPTGGSSTQGARYTGDGISWLRDLAMPGVAGPPKFVQNVGSANLAASGSSFSMPVTNLPAVGHTLLMTVSTSAPTVTSVIDPRGNTWVVDASSSYTSGAVSIVRGQVATAYQSGDTLTVNLSAANGQTSHAFVAEFTALPASPVDQTATNTSTTATTALDAGVTAATSEAVELVFAAWVCGGTSTATAGSGYTIIDAGSNVLTRPCISEYAATSTAGAQHPTATLSTAHGFAGVVVAYKSA
jgi:hypothetical protein